MSYDPSHTLDECDKCLKDVGKENLTPIPFLYLDRNDHMHKDYFPKDHNMKDYKIYFVCEKCLERELNSMQRLDKEPAIKTGIKINKCPDCGGKRIDCKSSRFSCIECGWWLSR